MKIPQFAQSKILTILSLAQMGKFFSHFGIRTLLVLYLVEHMRYSDSRAFGINALFCGLCELGGIFGGLIADRYLGLKKSTIFGGWLLALGYFLLILDNYFFLSLAFIIAGSGLFSGNIMALLGRSYSENDPRCKGGFTLFYMMQNLGALVSTIICGFIATRYSFKLGFACASFGMCFGNFILFFYRRSLPNYEETCLNKKQIFMSIACLFALLIFAALGVWSEKYLLWLLPWLTGGILIFFVMRLLKDKRRPKEEIYTLCILLGALILFFAVEDQICSSLLLFAERETCCTLFGWKIPSSFITSINPIVILLLGAFVAKKNIHMAAPFLITSSAFGLVAIFCLFNLNCSIFGVMCMVMVISVAELMIGPLVLSKTSELASKGTPGMVMGMVPITFSLAFQLSGGISKLVAIEEASFSLQIYGTGFAVVAAIMLLSGLVIHFLIKKVASSPA